MVVFLTIVGSKTTKKSKSDCFVTCLFSMCCVLVGIARFELTTSCSQSRHSNRAELYPVTFEIYPFEQNRKQTECDLFSKAGAKVLFFFDTHKFIILFWEFFNLLAD